MIKIDNKKFIWFPELKEKVKIKKQFLPEILKESEEEIYGKIVSIDGQYITIKYIGQNVGVGEHYRNELIPFGEYKQKKIKKRK
jgi:hypothetical protein